MYWLQGDAQGALTLLEEAQRWLPDYPPAALALARIHLAEGRADAALRHAQRAHRLRASVLSAWLSADACRALGDAVAAAAWDEQALVQGQRGDALALAEFLLARQRDPARVLALLAQERQTRGGIWLDALEARYPMLRGTIREHITLRCRPRVRFFANTDDVTHAPPDAALPASIAAGEEPLRIVGAVSGG